MFSSIDTRFQFCLERLPERLLAGLRVHINFNMLWKRGVGFHFLSWVFGLLVNVGTVTAYASVERVDLDLLFGLEHPG